MKKDYTKFVAGLFVLSVGVLFLLSALNVLGGVSVWRLIWPLAIVSVGCSALIPKGGKLVGAGVILAGLWLFVSPFTTLEIKYEYIISIVVALLGISIILSFFKGPKIFSGKGGKNELIVFSGKEDIVIDKDYEGGNAVIIFGGYTLDLSKMEITHDINISAFTLFGGLELFVPKNVKLDISTSAIFGGVENKAINIDSTDEFTIHINVFALFGGADINNR